MLHLRLNPEAAYDGYRIKTLHKVQSYTFISLVLYSVSIKK